MALDRIIASRPWIILAAWIIIVALIAPYAMKTEEVLKTGQEEFLPGDAESIRASKALEELLKNNGNEAAESPGYMAVVHGVSVNLDTYRNLKDWYMNEYRSMSPARPYSWIDIVYNVEARIKSGMKEALNGSLVALNGMVELSRSYNTTINQINLTASLIQAADNAYVNIYNLGYNLEQATPQLKGLQLALANVCYNITPRVGILLGDVVRVEALLETQTDAYIQESLDGIDVETVVNLTAAAGAPVDPILVGVVFNYTASIGGPSNWSNANALDLVEQLMMQGVDEELVPLVKATIEAWKSVVAGIDDLRKPVYASPIEGQKTVLSVITTLVNDAGKMAALNALDLLVQGQGSDSTLARLVGITTIEKGCKPEKSEEALLEAYTRFITEAGIPEDLAAEIAAKAVIGNFTSLDAAQVAVELLSAQMGDVKANATQLLEVLPGILVEYDPEANATLTGPGSVRVAVQLIASQSNLTLGESLEEIDTVEDAALLVMESVLKSRGGPALDYLRVMEDNGLLGAPPSVIVEASIDPIAVMISTRTNLTLDDAKAIVEAAARVYTGVSSLDEEAELLTQDSLEEAFPSIIEALKGVLVEKELNGFIVALEPGAGSLQDRVEEARESASLLEAGLKAKGYNPQVVVDGQEYMEYEIREAAMRDVQRSDRLSMIFVVVILALVLESLAAVFLPFIGIGFGLITSLAAAYILAKAGVIDLTSQSRTIMFTTGLGLGIDYAAYVSKKFREAVSTGLESKQAAAEAFRRSVRPVIAGAATASIGFGSMMLAKDFPFIASIGEAVPLTILAVMLASLTFIPALLAYVGSRRWFWWPRSPANTGGKHRLSGLASAIIGKPLAPLLLVALLTAGSLWVAVGFEGSYDPALNLPSDSQSKAALEIINKYYDPGSLYPVYIIASSPSHTNKIMQEVSGVECVARVDQANDRVVRVILSVDPMAPEGLECVEAIRGIVHSIDPGSLVGGAPAVNLDLRDMLTSVFYKRVYPVSLLLMFLTMLVAYGGVVTAFSAILSVGLAALWGTSLTVMVYQNVLGQEVVWFLPIIVFTAILGVGMDYNSFYLARAREECMKECSRGSIARSIALGSPIVLGLATIMAGAYFGLVLTSSPGLSQMGMALVLGVLMAGVNSGLMLTPPVIALLLKRAWWPSRRG